MIPITVLTGPENADSERKTEGLRPKETEVPQINILSLAKPAQSAWQALPGKCQPHLERREFNTLLVAATGREGYYFQPGKLSCCGGWSPVAIFHPQMAAVQSLVQQSPWTELVWNAT